MAARTIYQVMSFVLLILFATISTLDALAQNVCSLNNGQCRYQIQVLSECDLKQNVLNNPRYQQRYPFPNNNEESKPQASEEQNKRIHDLENKLNKVISNLENDRFKPSETFIEHRYNNSTRKNTELGNVVENTNAKKSSKRGSRSHNSVGFKRDPNRKENNLLNRVHKEFTKLREELTKTKNRLDITEHKLTDTTERLHQSESRRNDTLKQLTLTERKLEDKIAENLQLKDKLKALDDKLNNTKSELSKTKNDLSRMRIENWRSKAAADDCLKRLETCLREKETLRKALEQALIKYHELNVRHENVTTELNITQERLYRCYRGKTTTFCGFEDPEICGFKQVDNLDEVDWTHWRKSTPSANTGPSRDHTCNNRKGKYIYVEATKQAKGNRARLVSPYYHGYGQQCVEFYYHMFGQHTGILNVYTMVPGQDVVPMWRAFGNQGDVWTKARIDVSVKEANKGYQVVFEVSVGNGNEGDVALDDFRVFDGMCFAPSTHTPEWTTSTLNPMVTNNFLKNKTHKLRTGPKRTTKNKLQ